MRRSFQSVAPRWAATALLAAACGYTFSGRLPEHIKTVAVPVFANRTAEPAVENTLTRAVAEAFTSNGRLRVVTPAQADSILDGEITAYELLSIAYDPSANVRQYRLLVTMNVRFRDVRENKMLFQRTGFQERADFRVQAAVSETLARESDALREAAVKIGQSVVSAALDRF